MLVSRKSKRKPSGGLRHSLKRRDKVLTQFAGKPTLTTLSETERRKIVRGKGANKKVKLELARFANVISNGKNIKAEIKTVKENPANREFARRNIITKGALISVEVNGETKLARVTSRPGQSGVVNCVLVDEASLKKPKEHKTKAPNNKA